MRFISYNINGLRSAITKGFFQWLETDPADVICLQEVKAEPHQIDETVLRRLGFHTHWLCAARKGYSGVAVFSRIEPSAVFMGNGCTQSDEEGRVIRVDFGDLTLVNAYFPSGSSGALRQAYKYQWLNEFDEYIGKLREARPHLIVCGDYNIAHREVDIHNPVSNRKTSGFLKEERAWLDRFVESGMVDTFRHFNEAPHHYSWWSRRFPTVREQNKGWRIDYFFAAEPLRKRLKSAAILPHISYSDHCPVLLELHP